MGDGGKKGLEVDDTKKVEVDGSRVAQKFPGVRGEAEMKTPWRPPPPPPGTL